MSGATTTPNVSEQLKWQEDNY